VRDVRYAATEGVDSKAQSLDLYLPGTPGPHPVMVMVHGGGWRLGDKANRAMWKDKAPHFHREGWVYISVNYRLSNGEGLPPHPVHVQDVAKALAWVHNNIKQHGGDSEQIYLMGHSSGAHLAALVSTDERRLAAEGKKLSIIKGTICLDTAGYDIEKYLGAEMVAALRLAGVPATAIHASDKSHSGINACIGQKGDPYTALIMQFLANPSSASQLRLPKAQVGQTAEDG
jgi:acetyl esterase/lipase